MLTIYNVIMMESKYNIIRELDDGSYIVFNTFNCALKIFKNKEDYKKDSMFLTDIKEEENLSEKRKNTENSNEYAHYTIFTTTACNARCDYCFEKGCSIKYMSMETAEKIVSFIKEHSKNNKRIHIQFFGGEPLLNIDIIEYISKGLSELKDIVSYSSNIVTNGSLLNKKNFDILKKNNIRNIQITLDGTKEVYELRKKYVNLKNSYDIVINNIKEALKNKFFVSVRINFDKDNFDDILKLLDELSIFREYDNFYCYTMPLYSNGFNNKTLINLNEVNKYFSIIFNKMIDLGLIKSEKYFLLKPVSNHCAAVKRNTIVVYPDGNIFKCTHMLNDIIGNIEQGKIDPEKNKKYSNIILNNECLMCKFLPLCQGGCISDDKKCGSKCYVYKESFDEVLNSILKLRGSKVKIKEK